MCEAKQKIKELSSKRSLTKADLIALAEAQSHDYMAHQQEHKTMIQRVEKMESDLASVKEKVGAMQEGMGVMQEDIATIKGQLSVVIKYIESPADSERTKGKLLEFLGAMFKKPAFWIAVIIVALAGEKLATILEHLFPNLF